LKQELEEAVEYMFSDLELELKVTGYFKALTPPKKFTPFSPLAP